MTDPAGVWLDDLDQTILDQLAALQTRLDPPLGRPGRADPVRDRAGRDRHRGGAAQRRPARRLGRLLADGNYELMIESAGVVEVMSPAPIRIDLDALTRR
ncbi:MAG: hypothetical protein V7637_4588 [Mycobacteriales bacterium]|jgi:hypothetical protein